MNFVTGRARSGSGVGSKRRSPSWTVITASAPLASPPSSSAPSTTRSCRACRRQRNARTPRRTAANAYVASTRTRISAGAERPCELPVLDELSGGRFVAERAGPKCGAAQHRSSRHDLQEIDLGAGTAAHADDDDAAAMASACRFVARFGAPTSSSTTSYGPCARHLGRVDDASPRIRQHDSTQLAAMDACHHLGTLQATDLHAGETDSAGGTRHEQSLALPQPGLGAHRIMSRDEDFAKPSRLRPRPPSPARSMAVTRPARGRAPPVRRRRRWTSHGRPRRSGCSRSPVATTTPASSSPGDIGRDAGRRRVQPRPLHEVGAVQAGRFHLHEQFARLRARDRAARAISPDRLRSRLLARPGTVGGTWPAPVRLGYGPVMSALDNSAAHERLSSTARSPS